MNDEKAANIKKLEQRNKKVWASGNYGPKSEPYLKDDPYSVAYHEKKIAEKKEENRRRTKELRERCKREKPDKLPQRPLNRVQEIREELDGRDRPGLTPCLKVEAWVLSKKENIDISKIWIWPRPIPTEEEFEERYKKIRKNNLEDFIKSLGPVGPEDQEALEFLEQEYRDVILELAEAKKKAEKNPEKPKKKAPDFSTDEYKEKIEEVLTRWKADNLTGISIQKLAKIIRKSRGKTLEYVEEMVKEGTVSKDERGLFSLT